VEGIFVKQRTIYAALAVLALAGPAAAQGFEPGALPPYEIVTILRSTGLDPLGQPVRRGPHYVMRALDRTDREVRVVIAAHSGDIVSVTPVAGAPQMPPRGGVTMGGYERMPPGYIPPRNGAPVIDDDDDEPVSYNNPTAPRPPGALPGAPLPRSSSATRPPPRGGAMQPDDDDASPRSGPNVSTADPDRGGVLPPPPERFPQRVAPPSQPKPKPVTRAAAAPPPQASPPKQAPLPKPKPAAKVDAPQAAPSAPEQAQQKAPGAEETPH
jgi:hypothetical protein